jgi:hypothetical protein
MTVEALPIRVLDASPLITDAIRARGASAIGAGN